VVTQFARMLVIVLLGCCSTAWAQDYPSKPVFVVVPYAGGTGLDSLVRAVGQRMSETLRQPVLVENKPGANSIIGTDYVAKSAPDGYTLLLSTPALINNPSLYRNLGYDPFKDFTAVSGLVTTTIALAVHPSVPAKTLKELLELAKAKPGQISYASLGVGSTFHLTMELLEAMSGAKFNHVPYKGTPFPDVVAGHVQVLFSAVGSIAVFSKADKLRMLAVAAGTRSPLFPDVPTISEAGVPGYEASSWYGLHAPARTPKAVIDRLNAAAISAVTDRAFRTKNLDPQAFDPLVLTPEQFNSFLRAESEKWSTVIRDAKVQLD
jgi:tripartite-type tricarboxylate transporter receptor subunit TctC